MLCIEKIERKKREPNVYILLLTNKKAYEIFDELMVKYKFSVGTPIDEGILEEASRETQYYRGKNSALKFLRHKNRSLTEIEDYLKNKAFHMDLIDQVKKFLLENNLVNDEAFAEVYIKEAVSKGYGSLKIKHDLEMKGISQTVIDEKIYQHLSKEQEYERARLVFETKLKGQDPNEKNCAKAGRFLASKGYEWEIINALISKVMNIEV